MTTKILASPQQNFAVSAASFSVINYTSKNLCAKRFNFHIQQSTFVQLIYSNYTNISAFHYLALTCLTVRQSSTT